MIQGNPKIKVPCSLAIKLVGRGRKEGRKEERSLLS
jgi:hypothetical protein